MSMLNREYKVLSKLKIDISKEQLEFHMYFIKIQRAQY